MYTDLACEQRHQEIARFKNIQYFYNQIMVGLLEKSSALQ